VTRRRSRGRGTSTSSTHPGRNTSLTFFRRGLEECVSFTYLPYIVDADHSVSTGRAQHHFGRRCHHVRLLLFPLHSRFFPLKISSSPFLASIKTSTLSKIFKLSVELTVSVRPSLFVAFLPFLPSLPFLILLRFQGSRLQASRQGYLRGEDLQRRK
jgi:hypothetical protein